MKRIQITVSGKVQGVFYRNFIRTEAEKLGISGYAKNMSDGSVEIVAEGEKEALEALKKLCWKGPIMAFVKSVEVSDTDNDEEFEDFDIR